MREDAMNIEAEAKRQAEIKDLEQIYGREFLRRSLHEAGLRWRELTAQNAAERSVTKGDRA